MEEEVGGEKVTQIGVGGVRFKGELGKLDIIRCIGWGNREGEGERYVGLVSGRGSMEEKERGTKEVVKCRESMRGLGRERGDYGESGWLWVVRVCV